VQAEKEEGVIFLSTDEVALIQKRQMNKWDTGIYSRCRTTYIGGRFAGCDLSYRVAG
jgi:hypothetical protein